MNNIHTTFTRQGSQVQSLYRPPYFIIAFNSLLAFLSAAKKSWGQTGVEPSSSPSSPLKALCLASIFAVSGCATCQQHPVWCAIGSAVVVGSIAATIEANSGGHGHAASPCVNPANRSNAVVGSCAGR